MNEKQTAEAFPTLQQIGLLIIRINDMMLQLNAVMKSLMEENFALKKENDELKIKQKE